MQSVSRNALRLLPGMLLVALICLMGCSVPWLVRTNYVIIDHAAEAAKELPSLLEAYGLENQKADDSEFSFDLTQLKTISDLKRVQKIIQTWSEKRNIPVVLREASLTFSSVIGDGVGHFSLAGHATKGATVMLDMGGSSAVRVAVDDDGRWAVEVSNDKLGNLKKRGGYIYGVAQKDGAKQFFRISIFEANHSEPVSEQDLPSDSTLR